MPIVNDTGAADVAVGEVLLHPPFDEQFLSYEHHGAEEGGLGNALGRDCMVARLVGGSQRLHDADGSENEHWYSWGATLLAPFDGTVIKVQPNPTVNQPGTMDDGVAGYVEFLRADGVHVVYAHVHELRVVEGDQIRRGQAIGTVGNNARSRCPHVHIGAWHEGYPLQIRFDLNALADVVSRHGGH